MASNHTFSNGVTPNQRSITTGHHQDSAGAGVHERPGRGSAMPQPLRGKAVEVNDFGAPFVLGLTGGDPQRDLYVAVTYGGLPVATGQVARGSRR
jgi:hypothetical protein